MEAIVSAVPRTARAVTFMGTTTVSYRAFNARHPQVRTFTFKPTDVNPLPPCSTGDPLHARA